MYFSAQKSILTLLVLALVSISKVSAASTFTEIDISKTTGPGDAIKAAAQKSCGATLSAEELTRRHGLADTAEVDYFNPRILESLKANNIALNRALNCQKRRNIVLKTMCELQASIKMNLKCEMNQYNKDIVRNIKTANSTCRGVNEKLFVSVTGINEPKPPAPREKCGTKKPKQTFTSTFADVDITKTVGTGDSAKNEAERVCGANLSPEELIHRSNLGKVVENMFFNAQLKSAKANKPLKNALNCQKFKNKIMSYTCRIQAATKLNKPFDAQETTIERQQIIEKTTKACANVDPKLFVTVTGAGSGAGVRPSSAGSSASVLRSAAENNSFPSVAFLAAILVCLFA